MPPSQQPDAGVLTVLERIASGDTVLDVGAGTGRWADILRSLVARIDGVEVWKPNVIENRLADKYSTLYVANVLTLHDFRFWSVVILGDVLEHMSKEDGRGLVRALHSQVPKTFLVVPIDGPREQDGTVYGNPFETHLCDWSHEELVDLGFLELHRGTNPNGLVTIGTYVLEGKL